MRKIFDSTINTSEDDFKVYCQVNEFYKTTHKDYEDFVKDMKILNEDDLLWDLHKRQVLDKPVTYTGYIQAGEKNFPILPTPVESFQKAYDLIHIPGDFTVYEEGNTEFHFRYYENDVFYNIIILVCKQ